LMVLAAGAFERSIAMRYETSASTASKSAMTPTAASELDSK
jgi:hypothetical protein